MALPMPDAIMPVDSAHQLTNKILAHYDMHARTLPWRSAPGAPLPDPYRVWLSEIMLQQTTVAAVKPYFETFTARWPTVAALARADDAEVMAAWAGLGYYARARNLLACARGVARDYDGLFPADEAELLKLPGIGPYTAAAIAAIAFGHRAVVMDGNVERVIARYFAVETVMPKAKPELWALAERWTPAARPGDFAQAMMDLGATLCTPKSPSCTQCPIATGCKGRGNPTRFPVKPAKALRPDRHGTCWWIERDGQVLLIRRPSTGLLGGMAALPSCDWRGAPVAPLPATWHHGGDVRHVFTHFTLTLRVMIATVEAVDAAALGGFWHPIDRLDMAGLPSLFAKAAARATIARESFL
jgi:A/G-specific adenine glycosylase